MDYELMMNGNVKIGQRAPDFVAETTYGPVKLDDYKGKSVTVYTYQITNYPGYENRDCVFANLLVCDGMLIGGDVCSTSLSDGFMQGLEKQ